VVTLQLVTSHHSEAAAALNQGRTILQLSVQPEPLWSQRP